MSCVITQLMFRSVMASREERSILISTESNSRRQLSEKTCHRRHQGQKRHQPAGHQPHFVNDTRLQHNPATGVGNSSLHDIPAFALASLTILISEQNGEDLPEFVRAQNPSSGFLLHASVSPLRGRRHGVKQYRVIGPLPSNARISACRSARNTWLYVGVLVSPATLPTLIILPSTPEWYVGRFARGLDFLP
jgi:hypothetical protein